MINSLIVWIFLLVVLVLQRECMPLLDGVQDSPPSTQCAGCREGAKRECKERPTFEELP